MNRQNHNISGRFSLSEAQECRQLKKPKSDATNFVRYSSKLVRFLLAGLSFLGQNPLAVVLKVVPPPLDFALAQVECRESLPNQQEFF
ncbi:MAG: hypothetical protein QOF62_3143 [Pyrinomonadaceae bacterium]|jgi:hypothetical protein|nr:hypothetical protein [Pyrinomonadaceae bacterium]